jgi:DNA repair protein RecO (recombination protein O)
VSSSRQLQILGQTTLEASYQKIRLDYDKTAYAFAILELIDIFFQQGAVDPVFFDFLTVLFDEMSVIEDPRIIFWYFLLKLSSYLGFRPDFNYCKICSKELQTEQVVFSIRDGITFCENCKSHLAEGWKLKAPDRIFFSKLQKINHRDISATSLIVDEKFPYTDFMLLYLKYHSDEKLELSSLKLLK